MTLTRIPLLIFMGLMLNSCSQTPVLAQSAISEVVLQTIAMESANQSARGQQLVAHVIINRSMASNRSLEAVCKAHRQFSAWNDPKLARAWLASNYTNNVRQNAHKALEMAFKSSSYPTITHYHTKNVRPYWAKSMKVVVVEGEHIFYKEG